MSEPSKLRIHRLNREDLFPSFASLPAKRERANVVSETGDIQLALVPGGVQTATPAKPLCHAELWPGRHEAAGKQVSD